MPAVAEPPIKVEAPTPQDGGFADRLQQTIQTDPTAARLPGFQAPSAPVIPEKAPDAPTGTETGKETPPEVITPLKDEKKVETKPGAAELLKKLATGEQKAPIEEKPAVPHTAEEKKVFTFAQLRDQAKKESERAVALEKQVAEKEAKIAEFETRYKDIDPDLIKKTMEEKDKSLAEKEKKIAELNLLESDRFKKAVTEPLEAYKGDIKARAEKFKFSWRDFEDVLLTITDPDEQLAQIDKILDEAETPLSASQRANIVARVENINATSYHGAKLLQDAGEAKKSLDAEAARKSMEEKDNSSKTFKENSEFIFKQMFSEEMLEDMPWLAPKGEDGRPVADKPVLDKIRAAATQTKEPWRLALDSYSAELLPMVMEHSKAQEAKITELEERIGKLSGAGPKGGGAIVHEENGADDKLTLQERIERTMKSQGRL